MDITQIKIFPVEEEKLKAFVSIVFDHCFMINDIKVIEGKDGLFLSMPSRRKRSGEFKDVAHPLNNETRRRIELEVLEEYREIVDDPTPRRPDRKPAEQKKTSSESSETSAPESESRPAAQPDPAPAAKTEPARHEGLRDDPTVSSGEDAEAKKSPEPKQPSPAPRETREPEGAEEATDPESGAEEKEGDEVESPDALGEVQEKHLRDSFWQVT